MKSILSLAFGAIITAILCAFIANSKGLFQKDKNKRECAIEVIKSEIKLATITIVSAVCLLSGVIFLGALVKNITYNETKDMNWYDIGYAVANMPANAKDDTDISYPCIIVYTRASCPDCRKITPKIADQLDDFILPVYYASTRSNLGKEMLQKYPVTSVPMLAYIDKDGQAMYADPVTLYEENAYYNRQAVDSFLETVQIDLKTKTETPASVME